jgi:hypothetical protein
MRASFVTIFVAVFLVLPSPDSRAAEAHYPRFTITKIGLPGAHGLVTLDYFAFDRSHGKLWVPAGNLGVLDVIDAASDKIVTIGGFPTAAVELLGKKSMMGPSSISIGDGVIYIGNRGDSRICVVDTVKLVVRDCIGAAQPGKSLAAAPDAVVYVPTTKELWVTTGAPPLGVAAADRSIKILDASRPGRLQWNSKLMLDGSAEGYAVDAKRGLFYTSIEERGETIAIDVRRRRIVSRWHSGCDEPHGLALDERRRFLFVACADRVIALDAANEGRILGSLNTGPGLDNIDYSSSEKILYAAASQAATLTIAAVDDRGHLTAIVNLPTARGARCVVAGGRGVAYVADPYGGAILKIEAR